jgi:DNA repair exonuclease SbcCD ATPase subunit
MPNLQQTTCASCEEMAKQLKSLKAKLDQLRQGRQDIERLAHVRVRESESALADLLQENNMLREALAKNQSGLPESVDIDKERAEREELERLKKQLHAAEQEIQYYKEEFERWRRQAASVEDRLVATSNALQERTIAAQKFEERVQALELELSRLRAAAAAEPAQPLYKDLSGELEAAIVERDTAVLLARTLQSEVEELKRALTAQKLESEAAAAAARAEAQAARAQLDADLAASRQECTDVKAAAETAVAAAEASLKIAQGQRDELEMDLKGTKRAAQVK